MKTSSKQPRVALVYDRANTAHGGAEKVLLALNQAFPQAPLFSSVYDPQQAKWTQVFPNVHPSFLQKIPRAKKNHRLLAPLMPLAFESLDLSEFDVVISVTSAEAKGVLTRPGQLHICYLLTPTRHLYSHRQQYEQSQWPFQVPVLKNLSQKFFDYLKWWDQAAVYRPDMIVPISQLVAERTKKYYQRKTEKVIYPPVELTKPTSTQPNRLNSLNPLFMPSGAEATQPYYLVISRLVAYKKIDLAIKACQKLGKNLVIVGDGPERGNLEVLSHSPTNSQTTFLGQVSQDKLNIIIKNAQALLMPGVEDFGITALEAASQHCPVIIHQDSGAAELLENNKSALFLKQATEKELIKAITKLEKTQFSFDSFEKKIRKYTIEEFVLNFRQLVAQAWHKHKLER